MIVAFVHCRAPKREANKRRTGEVQGRIDPPKAGRGHATPVQPVQRAKCWRLLNLEPRFEWYHVRAHHNALIYRPYKETANVFLVTTSISPSTGCTGVACPLPAFGGSIRPWEVLFDLGVRIFVCNAWKRLSHSHCNAW